MSTFRDIPWNAPFYAKLGFQEMAEEDLDVPLLHIRDTEAQMGLPVADRILMQCAIPYDAHSRGDRTLPTYPMPESPLDPSRPARKTHFVSGHLTLT